MPTSRRTAHRFAVHLFVVLPVALAAQADHGAGLHADPATWPGGFESTVRDMLKVGVPSLVVAVLGVAAPFVLGWGVTARVLQDWARLNRRKRESFSARPSSMMCSGW